MLKNNQKEYCANNIAAMVIAYLSELFPDVRYSKLLSNFIGSKTYDALYDFSTGLWARGPGYILNEYLDEKKIKINRH